MDLSRERYIIFKLDSADNNIASALFLKDNDRR